MPPLHLQDLPAEILSTIHHHLYASITLHICSIPSSAHESYYPPRSHLPCIPKDAGKISPLHVTCYSDMLTGHVHDQQAPGARVRCSSCAGSVTGVYSGPSQDSSRTSIGRSRSSISILSRIATSTLTSPHLTSRTLRQSATPALQRAKWQALNVDFYGVDEILSHVELLPSPVRGVFARVATLDLNVQYSVAQLGRAMAAAYRDGPVLLDLVCCDLNGDVEPGWLMCCEMRCGMRLGASVMRFGRGEREGWASALEGVRVVFGRRVCNRGLMDGEDCLPGLWKGRVDKLREQGGLEVQTSFEIST